MAAPNEDHWLVRPRTIRVLWVALRRRPRARSCSPTSSSEHHPLFGLDGDLRLRRLVRLRCLRRAGRCSPRRSALVLKRPDTYYDDYD